VSTPEIRSFRSVFALERRVYRIDTLRLNPAGVPLRGIAYALAAVALGLVAASVPPTSWLEGVLPWYLREIGLPVALGAALASVRLDGRPFHLALIPALWRVLAPTRLYALTPARPPRGRWRPPALLCIPDGSDAGFRALRYRGPGAVLVRHPHLRREWSRRGRADVTLHPLAGRCDRATALELAAGTVLEVRPH
jgi:hypothetical protein